MGEAFWVFWVTLGLPFGGLGVALGVHFGGLGVALGRLQRAIVATDTLDSFRVASFLAILAPKECPEGSQHF